MPRHFSRFLVLVVRVMAMGLDSIVDTADYQRMILFQRSIAVEHVG
jgi:hypothetical protein